MPEKSQKRTAWRKNRKFGDVRGGRRFPKRKDNFFQRFHALERPERGADLPLLLVDTLSKDDFFPLTVQEAAAAIQAVPDGAGEGITHVWLRRRRPKERGDPNAPLAAYYAGAGVHAIVLYPWRRDLRLCWGRKPPPAKSRREYAPYCREPVSRRGWWYFEFTRESLRRFYLEILLFHEVGHHVDWSRRCWSPANKKQQEAFANEFARITTREGGYELEA